MGEESDGRRQNGDGDRAEPEDGEADAATAALSRRAVRRLAAREEFLLTVTEKGFGKRSSAYEYRITGRGGQGINNID